MNAKNNRTNRILSRSLMAFTLAAAGLLALPSVANAWGRGGGKGFHRRGKGGGMGMGKIMRGDLKRLQQRLGLAAWQVQKLKQLRQQQKGKFAKLHLQKARIKAQMRVEWLAKKPNAWKLKKLHQRLLKLKARAATQRFNIRLKVAQILTPAQRMKLKRMRGFRHRFGRRGKGFGRGMRGRRGRF